MRRFWILLLVAAAVAAFGVLLMRPASKPAAPTAAEINPGKPSNRVVIWRPYGRGAQPMQLCEGSKPCVTVDNTGPIAIATHPYYFYTADPKTLRVMPEPERISYLPSRPGPLTAGRHESTHPAIRYMGSWLWQQRDGPSAGEVHTALDTNSQVSFEFQGTGVEIGMAFYDDRRRASLCIDGICRDLSLFSHRLEWQQPVLVYGLKPGRHTATITLKAGKAIDVDWITVIGKKRNRYSYEWKIMRTL